MGVRRIRGPVTQSEGTRYRKPSGGSLKRATAVGLRIVVTTVAHQPRAPALLNYNQPQLQGWAHWSTDYNYYHWSMIGDTLGHDWQSSYGPYSLFVRSVSVLI